MKYIYIGIGLLTVYGDLLKGFLPPDIALGTLYGLAGVILLLMIACDKRSPVGTQQGNLMKMASLALIILYTVQIFPSVEGLTYAVINAAYVSIPLGFTVVILTCCSSFELRRLANVILWMIIPVSCVALIQLFLDTGFLVNMNYGEQGAVILRNFLEGGETFARLPSLYVSADRYSAMALMQLYFALVMLLNVNKRGIFSVLWPTFNCASALMALLISGARSRILITAIVFGAVSFSFLFSVVSPEGRQQCNKLARAVLLLLGTGVLIGIVLPGFTNLIFAREDPVFPVVKLLQQSKEQGDINERVTGTLMDSAPPQNVTLFGEGLGTVSETGRPGELGVASIWIESGLIWGSLMLLAFGGMILALLFPFFRSILSGQALKVALFGVPILQIVFALISGLSSSFELSSGVLLGCSLGAITRSFSNPTGSAVPRRIVKSLLSDPGCLS
jgi:hypothetical protein